MDKLAPVNCAKSSHRVHATIVHTSVCSHSSVCPVVHTSVCVQSFTLQCVSNRSHFSVCPIVHYLHFTKLAAKLIETAETEESDTEMREDAETREDAERREDAEEGSTDIARGGRI